MIEILVVTVVLSILVLLLFLAIPSIRDRAHGAQCLSHLRQIYTAMMTMAGDNDGALPFAHDPANSNASWSWYLLNGNYLPPFSSGMRTHPLLDPASQTHIPDSYIRGAYGINLEIAGSGNAERMRMVSVIHPSRKFLFFCAGAYLSNANQADYPSGILYLPGRSVNRSVTWPEEVHKDAIEGRHGKKIHTISVAGNVELWNADDIPTTPEYWDPKK